ncbi:fimbrial protein [Providencia sp. Je.9.19]|uniref:fimbrial protein n=1 Tax=unclassified Providencia TaxID=2633465 RepID=UPI003DA99177
MNFLSLQGRVVLGLFLSSAAFSALAATKADIGFKGNLIVNSPCELTAGDGSDTISVNFQEIVIRKLETQAANFNATTAAYQQPLPFRLVCDAENGTAVRVGLQGNASSFNNEFLATDNPNVGVQFINLGKGTFIPNSTSRRAQIIVGTPASFYVVPIRNSQVSTTEVATGGFKATATLLANYE